MTFVKHSIQQHQVNILKITPGTDTEIDYILDEKTNLKKFKFKSYKQRRVLQMEEE